MTDAQIHAQICDVADKVLSRLGKQSDGDPDVAIAALALAMCSLARANGTSLERLEEALTIAHEQVNGTEH